MASIHPNPSQTFPDAHKVRYRFPGGQAGATTFETRQSAERFTRRIDDYGLAKALETIGGAQDHQRASGKTVTECVEFYIAHRSGLTRGSRATYEAWHRIHIKPTLGTIRANQLASEDVAAWITAQAEKGSSQATMSRNHTLLSASLKLAVKQGWIRENAACGIKIPRTLRKRAAVFLTQEECDLILKSIDEPHRTLAEFLLASGCRIGEAAALTPADVNLTEGTVHFNKTHSRNDYLEERYVTGVPKTESSDRRIRMPQKVLEKLDLSGRFVFTYNGEQVKDAVWRKAIWIPALHRSGLPVHRRPRVHDLRHTHASRLLHAGIPIPAVQERLGHQDVMTTLRIYAHARADVEDDILAALG